MDIEEILSVYNEDRLSTREDKESLKKELDKENDDDIIKDIEPDGC